MPNEVHMVCMPNGMVVSCKVVASVYDVLYHLKNELQTQYIFWELVHTSRFPNYEMTEKAKDYFASKGFLNTTGFIKADVQNIILFLTEGNEPDIKLVNHGELHKIFTSAYDWQEVE